MTLLIRLQKAVGLRCCAEKSLVVVSEVWPTLSWSSSTAGLPLTLDRITELIRARFRLASVVAG
jgi:hypothetical protein